MALGSNLLLDTSGLLSALFPDQAEHEKSATVLSGWTGRLLLSPFVLAEADYLITKFGGAALARDFLEDVAARAYELVDFSAGDVRHALEVLNGGAVSEAGLTDASIVVLSHRYGTLDLLSLDKRHFRVLLGAGARPFRLLPFDS